MPLSVVGMGTKRSVAAFKAWPESCPIAGGGSTITDSVLFDQVHVGQGARIHRAVLDKNVILDDGATVGVDRERDIARGFTVTESGITVVGKGIRIER